jgi:hypothetical protein
VFVKASKVDVVCAVVGSWKREERGGGGDRNGSKESKDYFPQLRL